MRLTLTLTLILHLNPNLTLTLTLTLLVLVVVVVFSRFFFRLSYLVLRRLAFPTHTSVFFSLCVSFSLLTVAEREWANINRKREETSKLGVRIFIKPSRIKLKAIKLKLITGNPL